MEKQYIDIYRKSNKLLVREIVSGKETISSVYFKPHLYHRTANKNSGYTDYFGKPVDKVVYENMWEMSKDLKEYGTIEGELWGMENPMYQYIQENYDTTNFDPNILNIAFIDIEVNTSSYINGKLVDGGFPEPEEAKFPITAICQKNSNNENYFVFTTAKWDKSKSILNYKEKVEYIYCKSEEDILKKWILFVEKTKPHVWSGWNVQLFDFPYIINRMKILFGEDEINKLSPFEIVENKSRKDNFGVVHQSYVIAGTPIIDLLDAYKKYCLSNREKYTLDHIMKVEFPNDESKRKLEFEEQTHGELYFKDPQLHTDYVTGDVKCCVDLEEARKFIFLCISLSYYAKTEIGGNFSTTKFWDTIMYNEAEKRKVAIPLKKHKEKEEFEGAHVFETKVGLHKCVVSFDGTSLYPTCTRVLNCGYESLVREPEATKHWKNLCELAKRNNDEEFFQALIKKKTEDYFVKYLNYPSYFTKYLQEHDICMSPVCCFFKVDKTSIQSEVTAKLFNERKENKKAMQVYDKYTEACIEEMKRRGLM